jgi:hypothetical protein
MQHKRSNTNVWKVLLTVARLSIMLSKVFLSILFWLQKLSSVYRAKIILFFPSKDCKNSCALKPSKFYVTILKASFPQHRQHFYFCWGGGGYGEGLRDKFFRTKVFGFRAFHIIVFFVGIEGNHV